MKFKIKNSSTVGKWRFVIAWTNKEWTRATVEYLATKAMVNRYTAYEFTIYSLQAELIDAGIQPIESTLRQIIKRLVGHKLIENIKE